MTVNIKQDPETPLAIPHIDKTKFYGCYQDFMELSAPQDKVAEYLDSHSSWFVRCAEPMIAQPLGENAYELIIGSFGAFGYEVEPKIGLELLPGDSGIYRIKTISIPDYNSPGYEVDYQAVMELVESVSPVGEKTTRVAWKLDLTVELQFPRFIYRLPQSLIQSTGDRLLNQIVRQVARRLTRKVQSDFHQNFSVTREESHPPN